MDAPRVGRGKQRLSRLSAAVSGTASAAALTLPDRFGLDRWNPFAVIAPLRLQIAALLIVTGIVGYAVGGRRARAGALAVVLVAALAAAVTATRSDGGPEPVRPGERPVTLLSFNVDAGRADPDELADLIRRERADLVVLPEAGAPMTASLLARLGPEGYRGWSSTTAAQPDAAGVSLLAGPLVGDLDVRPGHEMQYPYLEAHGPALGDYGLVAAHTVAPLPPGSVQRWRHDHDLVGRWCAPGRRLIVAGDLNSTLDHSVLRTALGGCRDAAQVTGTSLVGTWPTVLPRWLGIQIDHVLAPREVRIHALDVMNVTGSDHRAVLVRLGLP